jgi:hypothetical protein
MYITVVQYFEVKGAYDTFKLIEYICKIMSSIIFKTVIFI